MNTQPMSNSEHDRLTEEAHRHQRMADALTADLPQCKSVDERKRTLETIARMTMAARAAHAELVRVRGW